MLQKSIDWVKTHKVVVLLVIVIFFLLGKSSRMMPVPLMMGGAARNFATSEVAMDSYASPETMSYGAGSKGMMASSIAPVPPIYPGQSVDISATNRKVVRDSYLSLLVKDVRGSIDQITQFANQAGGFMVNSAVSTPDQGGSGNISIRVPADKLNSTLQYLRGLSVRVVTENITGSDITDQYTDVQARLETLTKTKATFEAMLDQTRTVDEILRVQQSILQVQDQIDSYKGQLEYLDKTSQSSLITIYLSTDELALPYSPTEPWRPSVIFKTAVRSLMMNLRNLASAGIWILVYSPVVIVIGIIFLVIRSILKRKALHQHV